MSNVKKQNFTIMKKNLCIFVWSAFAVVSANAQQRVNLVGSPDNSGFVPSVQGPEIQFERLVHDYGEVVAGANGDTEFKFKNIGSEPLVLLEVRPSCNSCVSIPNYTREPIMPGQEGVVKVRYNTQIEGPMTKTVTVFTNGKTNRVALRLNGNVNTK
jgi:hypothetical protein